MKRPSKVSDGDRVLLTRLVDGALGDLEQRSLRTRVEREPALAEALADLRATRSWFADARAGEPPSRVPADFASRVIDGVRRLPDPAELAAAEARAAAQAHRLVRRLTLAALVIFGAALLFTAGLWTARDASVLEASPAEIERAMQELDASISAEPGDGSWASRERGR